jgi:hypothetical protein
MIGWRVPIVTHRITAVVIDLYLSIWAGLINNVFQTIIKNVYSVSVLW